MRAGSRRAGCFSNSMSELGLRGATEIPPEDVSPRLIRGMGSRASGEEVRRLGSGCMCERDCVSIYTQRWKGLSV